MLANMDAQISPDEARVGFQSIDTNDDLVMGRGELIE
jgi:hypothetical protein